MLLRVARCLAVLFFHFGIGIAHSRAGADVSQFYDPALTQTVHLTISPADLKRLNDALPKRVSVPGSFRWKDHSVTNVGIRYKGNSSSSKNSTHKRSFLVEFSEFEKGQRFLGLQHVALDNAIQFGSLFSEPLITEILRGEGVKASRCNYANVFLNGKEIGVYVNVERIDRTFIKHHFGDNRGILFKVDEGGPGADLQSLGPDLNRYRKAFELRSGTTNEAYAELLKLVRSVNETNSPPGSLSHIVAVDEFLKTTAVLLFAGAFDQYTGWSPHNYYLYQDPKDERWTYIPWDLDVGFADKAFGRIPVLSGWNAAWPAPAAGRPLMERILSDPDLLARYRREASRILDRWFRPETLIPKLTALHRQIRPMLATDPFPPRRATTPTDRSYDDILKSMEAFIRDRYVLARSQLDSPENRPEFAKLLSGQNHDPGGPKPGPASDDAPSGLRLGKLTSSSVELRWRDNAKNEFATVVQRCEGPECGDFVNLVGLPGDNITSATDSAVNPGSTYRYRVYAVHPTPQGPRGTGVSNVLTVKIAAE